jgi:hypothetical protein
MVVDGSWGIGILMPILSAPRKERARAYLRKYVHNDLTMVKLKWATQTVQSNPHIAGDRVPRMSFPILNFPHRVTQLESGKLNRIFKNRFAELNLPEGLMDTVAYEIQYVNDLYELEVRTGICSNVLPDARVLVDNDAVFTNTPLRNSVGLVRNETDKSQGFITEISETTITVDSLSFGTLNVFTLNDAYTLLAKTELLPGDQIYVKGKWRTVVLNVVDSEGLQHTVFVAD